MQKLIGMALLLSGILAMSCLIFLLADLLSVRPRLHKTDCTLASFHPDIPKDVRKACRERGET